MQKEELKKAVMAHTRWKYRLLDVVEAGESFLTVAEAENTHLCDLGKWLDSAAGKTLSNYDEIVQIHQAFHKEAAYILALALAGKRAEAKMRIELGGQFSKLTSQLINKLAESNQILID